MLAYWRRQSKVLTYVIFSAIILVFIVWGFERRQMGSLGTGQAASVNGRIVTVRQFRQELARRVNMYQQMLGGRFEGDIAKQFNLPAQTLGNLIEREVALDGAESSGLRASDEEVRDQLLKLQFLQKDGRFSREQYDALLKYNKLTSQQFEEDIRSEATIGKLQRVFTQSMVTAPSYLQKEQSLKGKLYSVEFIHFDLDQLSESKKPSADQIKAFLSSEKNKKRVDEYYQAHKEEFAKPARVKARHILVKAKEGEKEADTLKRIENIKSELKGSKFETLATKYSDDISTKIKGGDLGWFEQGKMVPEFEKAAFALNPGQVSEPIKTSFGLHLIKVEAKEAAQNPSEAQAKEEIISKLALRELVEQALNELNQGMKTNPAQAIEKFQKAFPAAKWEETGTFSLYNDRLPKLGDSEVLLTAALDLSAQKPYSSEVLTADSGKYVLKYKEPKADANKGLDEAMGANRPSGTAQSALGQWVSVLHKKADISQNKQLLQASTGEE